MRIFSMAILADVPLSHRPVKPTMDKMAILMDKMVFHKYDHISRYLFQSTEVVQINNG
jgi:hypothetical protein